MNYVIYKFFKRVEKILSSEKKKNFLKILNGSKKLGGQNVKM